MGTRKATVITRHKLERGITIVKRGDTWHAEICRDGKRERFTLDTGDLSEATKRVKEGWRPDMAPPPPPPPPKGGKDILTLAKLGKEYIGWYEKNRRSAGRTQAAITPFIKAAGETLDVAALTRERIQKWVDAWSEEHAALTVRSDFSRVRAFIRWSAARKDLPALFNVCRGIDQPRDEDTARPAPSPEKVRAVLRKLYESGHPWMGDYFRILVETGARPAEILGLRGIDVRGKLVSIVPWEGRLLKSKWSKRTIEVNAAVTEILEKRKEAMLDKTRPIFMTELGGVYQSHSAGHLLNEILADGRGKDVPAELALGLYDARHFFASEHAAAGPSHMSIESLMSYLGHSPASIKVLLRFYVDADALRRGAPSVLGEKKDGNVIEMRKGNG